MTRQIVAGGQQTTADNLREADGRLPEGLIRYRQIAVDGSGAIVGFGFARRHPDDDPASRAYAETRGTPWTSTSSGRSWT